MHRIRYKLVAALCLAFLLAQAVSGCKPQTVEPAPTATEKAQVAPTPTAVEKDEVASPTPDRRGQPFFAPDHMILTGPRTRVKEVVADLEQRPGGLPSSVTLEQIGASLDLSYLDKLVDACRALSMFQDKPADDPVVMELYQINPTGQLYLGDIPLAVLVAEQVNRDSQDSLVFADLTYLTGRPPFPLDGDPWTGEGSPWTGEGSNGADPAAAAQASFWTQWALGSRDRGGIGLIAGEGGRSTGYEGKGIRVGVFDTTPYAGTNVETVDWVTPPLMLSVVAQPLVPSLEDLIRMPLPSGPPIPDHGLFVAGLVHAVAPGSEIHLYQVLDDYGHGHSWALNEALHKFITQTLADRDKLDGAVINLSFGGNLPTDLQGREVLSFQDLQSHGLPGDVIARLPEDVTSLYVLLSSAYCSGIVVSAASGNDSAGAEQAKLAQFPASAFQCLAVAASDSQRRRACFSNQGRVAAPGGTGTEPGCTPALDTCADDCAYAVISLVSRPDDNSTGYAFWAGTSFATPLASGLAALVLEAEGGWSSADGSSLDGTLTEHVWGRIANCAALSDGIINVPETLANGSCPGP